MNASPAKIWHRNYLRCDWVLKQVMHMQIDCVKSHKREPIVLTKVAFVNSAWDIRIAKTRSDEGLTHFRSRGRCNREYCVLSYLRLLF